jgi:glycosyltransferase involved in cell wall biosynthesis
MKLLLAVHDIGTRGGMEVQLAHLAEGLAAAGHQVRLVSVRSFADTDQEPASRLHDSAVQLAHLGATGRWSKVASLGRLRRLAQRSDVVHCTGWDASLWGRLAAILARRPVIVSEHSPGRQYQVSPAGAPRGGWIASHNRALDRFTAVTVMCAEWQRDMLEREGVARRKLICIPNGVPVNELRKRARIGTTRAQLGIPTDAKVLAQVARFVPQKRQLLALETTARLRRVLGDVRIVFAGEGPELATVRHAAEARGADWAIFLGRHDNIPSVFALSDLAILPSAGEAMPMAIIEAIAVGVPVIATAVGEVGHVLDRTGAGIHVPAADEEAFYLACRRVLSDEAVHSRLASSALAASAQIDAATMVKRYERVFDGVLRGVDPAALASLAEGTG